MVLRFSGHDARTAAHPASLEWRRRSAFLLDDGGTVPLLTVEEQLRLSSVLRGRARRRDVPAPLERWYFRLFRPRASLSVVNRWENDLGEKWRASLLTALPLLACRLLRGGVRPPAIRPPTTARRERG